MKNESNLSSQLSSPTFTLPLLRFGQSGVSNKCNDDNAILRDIGKHFLEIVNLTTVAKVKISTIHPSPTFAAGDSQSTQHNISVQVFSYIPIGWSFSERPIED